MNRKHRVRRAGLVLTCALAVTSPALAEEMLYLVEGGKVVFTNTPSRSDVKPVPGFRGTSPTRGIPAGRLPATRWDADIERVGAEVGLSGALLKAVIQVESAFNPRAVSPKGAQGLMQLMPATAAEYGVRDSFDPVDNMRGGARYLRDLLEQFDGNLELALAAYNAGAGAVRRHGGVPAYRETRDYVQKVQQRLERPGRSAPAVVTETISTESIRLVHRADGSVALVN